nr:hypothetical protein [Rubellimicrobium arenae]
MAPAGYRRKRLRDAAYLLPLLGVVLLLIPLLWTPSDDVGGVGNAASLLFVFGVWAGLIALAFVLSLVLGPNAEGAETRDDLP